MWDSELGNCIHIGELFQQLARRLSRSLHISEPQFIFLENVVFWGQGAISYNSVFESAL